MVVDWDWARTLALPVVNELITEAPPAKRYWNVNLPHTEVGAAVGVARCDPDDEPLDVRFHREGEQFHYAGVYLARRRTPGRDVDRCFEGSITVSCLRL